MELVYTHSVTMGTWEEGLVSSCTHGVELCMECGWQWSGNTTITDNLLIVIWHKTSLCCIGSSSLLKTMISSAFNESDWSHQQSSMYIGTCPDQSYPSQGSGSETRDFSTKVRFLISTCTVACNVEELKSPGRGDECSSHGGQYFPELA